MKTKFDLLFQKLDEQKIPHTSEIEKVCLIEDGPRYGIHFSIRKDDDLHMTDTFHSLKISYYRSEDKDGIHFTVLFSEIQ